MKTAQKCILFVLLLCFVLFVFIACGDNTNEVTDEIHAVYRLYLENGGTMTYAEWLLTIKGDKGDSGRGISSVTKIGSDETGDTYKFQFTDGTSSFFTIPKGEKGDKGDPGEQGKQGEKGDKGETGAQGEKGDSGKGIVSVTKTGTNGLIDIYTILFDDGTQTTFSITNGAQGQKGDTGEKGDKGDTGSQGAQGQKGENGATGAQGRGILSAYIDEDGYLVLVYTDGEEEKILQKIKEVHGHAVVETTIVERAPTCTSTGITYIVCETCNELIRTIIAAKIPHSYEDEVTAPTCTQRGYTTHTCSQCGYSFVDTYVEATGHSYSDEYEYDDTEHWHPVTCGHTGVEIKEQHNLIDGVCSVCGLNVLDLPQLRFEKKNGEEEYMVVGAISNRIIEACIPAEYDGLPVTEIKDNAFKGFSFLKKVTIPSSVKTIGNRAFYECQSLVDVSMEEGLDRIGDEAFYYCLSLVRLSIPDSVTSIGRYSFLGAGCCVIYQNVAYVDDWCVWMASLGGDTYGLTIKSGTRGIADYAFSINGVFRVTIRNVLIRDGVQYIGRQAFYGQPLSIVALPNTLKEIGTAAFDDMQLSAVFYNGSEEERDQIIVGDLNSDLTDANWVYDAEMIFVENQDNTYTLAGYNGNAAEVTVPSTYDGKPVSGIGQGAFQLCLSVEKVIIEEGLTSIGAYAFSECARLTTIEIPQSMTTIDEDAFYEAIKLVHFVDKSGRFTFDDVGWWMQEEQCRPYRNAIEIKGNENDFENVIATDENGVMTYTVGDTVYLFGYSGEEEVLDLSDYTFDDLWLCAFAAHTKLTQIVLPEGLSRIAYAAFIDCLSLTSVTLPSSIEGIEGSAFFDCPSFACVYYTGDIASWCGIEFGYEGNPLSYAHNLYINNELVTDLVIPEGVTEIKDYTFRGATCLTSVTIPDSVTSIGDYAFYNCTSLTSITISDSVTSIGSSAFRGCTSLTSVYYTGDIASWCGITFSNDEANPLSYAHNLYINNELVTDLVIPEGVTEIKNHAFKGATCLTSVTIPDSVTSIGYQAFSGCTSLTSVYYTGDIASWCWITFGDWESNPLQYAHILYINNELVTDLVIPDGVTEIKDYAFRGATCLASVTIPDSVTSIGSYAFSGCTATIEWGNNPTITTIGNSAFSEYKGTSITIPDGVTSIGNWAFEDCTGLTSITIPDSVTSIGYQAFSGCTSLTSVYYTGDIASWCWITFGDWESNPLQYAHILYINNELVTDLVIPDGVTEIKNYAFYGATCLTSVTIPDSVTSIGSYAFRYCTSLTSVTIGNGVTSIGYSAFEGCYKLVEVFNKSSLNITKGSSANGYVGYYAKNVYTQEGGSKLSTDENGYILYTDGEDISLIGYAGTDTELTLPAGITEINQYAFYDNTNINSVTIPDSVTSIGEDAFFYCISLTSVTIGNSVTSIGEDAFFYCISLTSVTIGNSVTSIEWQAFYNCTSLTRITFQGTKAQWSAISKGSGWNNNTGSYTIYCTDGNIAK